MPTPRDTTSNVSVMEYKPLVEAIIQKYKETPEVIPEKLVKLFNMLNFTIDARIKLLRQFGLDDPTLGR